MCFVPVNNTVTVLKIYKVYISLHSYCLVFLMFLSFQIVFPPMSCLRLLFLQKARSRLIEKVLCRALFAFNMGQWFWIICFILGSVRLYVTALDNTWAFCDVYSVSNFFLSRSLIFLLLVTMEDEPQPLFVNCSWILCDCARIRCLLRNFTLLAVRNTVF